MANSKTFPSDKEDEREQRLIRDLRHLYHTEVEIAQALSRVRSHVEGTAQVGRIFAPARNNRMGCSQRSKQALVRRMGMAPLPGSLGERRGNSVPAPSQQRFSSLCLSAR